MLFSKNAPRKGRFFWRKAIAAVGAAAFVAGFLAPNHYLPWVSFHNEAPIFAALLALTLALSFNAHQVVAPRALWWGCAAVVGSIALQLACGTVLYSGHAVVGVLYVGGVAMAWRLGAASVRLALKPESCLSGAAAVTALVAVVSAFIAILQWLRLESAFNIFAVELGPGARPSGNLAQPNLLATLVVMGVVATGLLWHQARLRAWQALALLAYLSFALVMTESRAGLLSAACVSALVLLHPKTFGRASNWRAIAVWWLLLAVFRWSWAPLNELLLLQSARQVHIGVDSVRLVLWAQILSAILQRPWAGYGWNQTPVAQKSGVEAAPGAWPTDYAHNVVLDVIAWFGIPVGLVLVGCVVWWLARAAWRIKNATELLLFCFAVPVLVHSMLEFPFAYAFFLFPVACALGALHALQAPEAWPIRPAATGRDRQLIATVLISAYALVAGRVFVEYLAVEEDMRVMRFELRRVGLRPVDYAPPRLVVLNQWDEMLRLGRVRPDRGMAPELLARMGRANAFLNWATLHLNYVIALGLNGQAEEASRQLRILRDVYGPRSYRQATAELEAQRTHRFPELAEINVP